jgi:hypothetical protein
VTAESPAALGEGDWWEGALEGGGAPGLFPANHVEPAPAAAAADGTAEEEKKVAAPAPAPSALEPEPAVGPAAAAGGGTSGGTGVTVTATVDYVAEHAGDLGLTAGDVVVVIDDADADWWRGYKLGDASKTVGAFPLNHAVVNAAVGGVVVALQAFAGPEPGDLIFSEGVRRPPPARPPARSRRASDGAHSVLCAHIHSARSY